MRPLEGVRVLDFSTLLPGPMATLLLAEAGAEVIKIERPGVGDEMRIYQPKVGPDSVNFALLNRGKCSVAIDLKAPGALEKMRPLIESADVVVEQFRPGVMDRLGLGWEAMRKMNPRIIYCAITGYGQTGPKVDVAAHDLNYVADSGMLSLAAGSDGAPVVPAALVADIAGGAYPAVINILLALQRREKTGAGAFLDISMSDTLWAFLYASMGDGLVAGKWPAPASQITTGGSPRYNVYRAKDGRYLAAAPLEQRFWTQFCEAIDLAPEWRDDSRDPAGTRRAVAARIAERTSAEWSAALGGKDVCCNLVATVEEAMQDPHFRARGLFERRLALDGRTMPALPVPIDEAVRGDAVEAGYCRLGDANRLLGEG
jgi:crotonobetainyl-CoA:carnitine CoA-transferase CaiB-like acyl-CoA transferase